MKNELLKKLKEELDKDKKPYIIILEDNDIVTTSISGTGQELSSLIGTVMIENNDFCNLVIRTSDEVILEIENRNSDTN